LSVYITAFGLFPIIHWSRGNIVTISNHGEGLIYGIGLLLAGIVLVFIGSVVRS
jgi:hypothetical protein